MCFYTSQTEEAVQLKNRYKANFKDSEKFIPKNVFNAFEHPYLPIIKNSNQEEIVLSSWGLIPHWATNMRIRKSTLNARLETLYEKPSFKHYISQRCLLLVDGFYEWKWLDEKGKYKERYYITASDSFFSIAALWNDWVDNSSGEIISSFTLITTQANELMSEIHNTKKRMPLILLPQNEKKWLEYGQISNESLNLSARLI
jgi:putative SOS response-associated peptidase YedK